MTCRPSAAILGRARSLHGYSSSLLHRSGCASTRRSARYPPTLGSLNKPASSSDTSWPSRQRSGITTAERFRQGADHVITRDWGGGKKDGGAPSFTPGPRPRPPSPIQGPATPRRACARGSRGVSLSAPPPAAPALSAPPSLRPVSRRQRRRQLAQLVGSLYKGEKQADRTAGAAAGGGSGGAGSGDRCWFPSSAPSGERVTPPNPLRGRGLFSFFHFFFFL